MNSSLADRIEKYIKVLIARSKEHKIEIQRAEIAETFSCVPSQVTYVLRTRFKENDGYYKESRRGGRGYVRITEIQPEELSGDKQVMQLINQLSAMNLIDEREITLLQHIVINVGKDLNSHERMRFNKEITNALRQFFAIY